MAERRAVTVHRWALLLALLCTGPGPARAQQPPAAPAVPAAPARSEATEAPSTPSAAELAESAEVLDATSHQQALERAEDEPEQDVFEITWTTLVTASGGEPETNLQLDDEGWRVEDLLRPRRNKIYPSTSLSMYGEIVATDWLLFRGLFDTREVRDGATLEPPLEGVTMGGNTAAEELRSGAVLRELSALIGDDELSVELGRFQSDVAEGLVYEDYGTGLRLRADFERLDVAPLQVELLITTVGQRVEELGNNELLALRVDWTFAPFEYVALVFAASNDESGEISDVLRSAYAENLLDSQAGLSSLFLQEQGRGGHGYLGLMSRFTLLDETVLRARVMLSGGDLELRVPLETLDTPEQQLDGRTIDIEVGGFAADVELRYGVSDAVELTGFLFVLSGDRPPSTEGGRYRSFIGLAPYWVWSGLFFSGGLAQGLYPNRATAAGVNGRGVVGLGPSLELSGERGRAELRAVVLGAATDPPEPPLGGDRRSYGTELDLRAELELLPFLKVGTELDVFFPGRFFPTRRIAYLVLGMVSVTNAP